MTEVKVAAIVEGHGECEAVPILVRRIAQAIDPGFVPKVLSPLRVPASRLLKEGEIERSVDFAARKLQGRGGILVIVDCDWENGCPAEDGPVLLKRAAATRGDLPIAIILAKGNLRRGFWRQRNLCGDSTASLTILSRLRTRRRSAVQRNG